MHLRYRLFVLISVVLTVFGETDHCREGTYGNNCELTCPDQCRPLQTFPCDKRTGRCAEGCNGGYYGDQCNKQCFCASGICFQANGECYGAGTTTPIMTTGVGPTTETTVHTPVCGGVSAGWRTAAALLIVIIIILVVGGMMVFLKIRKPHLFTRPRCMKRESEQSTTHTEEETHGKLLLSEEGGAEAAGSQSKTRKTLDCLPTTNQPSNDMKQGTEIQELKNDVAKLESEKHQMIEEYKKREKTDDRRGLPTNSTNHLIDTKKWDHSIWLQCPHLEFDKERVNVKVAHVDDKMVLLNIPDPRNPVDNSGRFQHFSGTTCTHPLVATGFCQYFEAIFNIDLKRSFGDGEVVIQLGFCRGKEGDFDTNKFTQRENCDFLLEVVGCKKHKTICLVCTCAGNTEHLKKLIDNSVGSTTNFNIGIRLSKDMERIKVYDETMVNMLKKEKIKVGEKIWPMFGLCEQHVASVKVELKAGRDIEMSDEKKKTLK